MVHTDADVTGPLLGGLLWVPITLALLFAGVILSWLLSRPGLSPAGQAFDSDLAAVDSRSISASGGQNHNDEGSLSPVFSPEVLQWSSDILRWSAAFNLDPNLVATVMQIESCGHPSVRSSAGAIGLFQVMPYHFLPGEDPIDPQTNANRGLAYLARGLELAGGRSDLALAGYNGGHGVITRDASRWSAETQRFVAWGGGILNDISTGSTESPSLQSWLQAGGNSLCHRASLAIASLPTTSTP